MKIEVKVIANARQQKIEKIGDFSYKIWIKSKARDGLANKELIAFLSDYFNVSLTSVNILKGQKFSRKVIELSTNGD